MDLFSLRIVLRPIVISVKDRCHCTHATLPSICETLGMKIPSGETSKTKAEKLEESFNSLYDIDLPCLAERLLKHYPPSAEERNKIQEILWADANIPEIPKRFRRELAQAIYIDELYIDPQRFDNLLEKLWVLNKSNFENSFYGKPTLQAEIQQHVHNNRGDWSTEYLFDQLGAFDASDRRFALFLEGLASSNVRPDESSQRRFVQIVNKSLQGCGLEMRESGTEGGYPEFTVVSKYTATMGRPKNLIFGSSVKPDIRFRDAVNNDIEIVTNIDKVLVYDQPIGREGLRWRDLQSWWSETKKISEDEAKTQLYHRLRDCLPSNSPPQKNLFEAYFRSFGSAIPNLPALLPEVWLHWDPKTVKERGPDALLRFRMDFLLLLPHGIRVVIEVDGIHHYASTDKRADPSRYAAMVGADRELKLAGYEVYRFGTEELQGKETQKIITNFFKTLFNRYGLDS